jgi:hypothetical protein
VSFKNIASILVLLVLICQPSFAGRQRHNARPAPQPARVAQRPAAGPLSASIAGGHAWAKHSSEYRGVNYNGGPVNNQAKFQLLVFNIITSGAVHKPLARGRNAWWNQATGTVVIYDPRSADKGTAFRPTAGRSYYTGLK